MTSDPIRYPTPSLDGHSKDEEGSSAGGASLQFLPQDDSIIHHPLGAGSYIFQKSFLTSTLRNVGAIPLTPKPKSIIIHIGAQPNNSPHAGTMIVFTLAFLLAQGLKRDYDAFCHKANPSANVKPLDVQISLDLVDTAPDSSKIVEINGIKYQLSHRATGAMSEFLPDYHELLHRLSEFTSGEIPVQVTNQTDLLSTPTIPRILNAITRDHRRLGWELSPDRGKLALRSACPEPGCHLADKHGMKTEFRFDEVAVVKPAQESRKKRKLDEEYDVAIEFGAQGHITGVHPHPESSSKRAFGDEISKDRKFDEPQSRANGARDFIAQADHPNLRDRKLDEEQSSVSGTKIIFLCPYHGPYTCSLSSAEDIKLLEFNTPLRNLVRTLANGLDTVSSRDTGIERLHIRVTGSDYSGGYQEQLLYRQLMIMPVAKGLPPPMIVYAPLILDWAGSKLSKSLYVRDGAYEYLKSLGKDYLLSYSRMKEMGKDPMVLAREVERWLEEPKKLFRHYTIEYLHRVFEDETRPQDNVNNRDEQLSC